MTEELKDSGLDEKRSQLFGYRITNCETLMAKLEEKVASNETRDTALYFKHEERLSNLETSGIASAARINTTEAIVEDIKTWMRQENKDNREWVEKQISEINTNIGKIYESFDKLKNKSLQIYQGLVFTAIGAIISLVAKYVYDGIVQKGTP